MGGRAVCGPDVFGLRFSHRFDDRDVADKVQLRIGSDPVQSQLCTVPLHDGNDLGGHEAPPANSDHFLRTEHSLLFRVLDILQKTQKAWLQAAVYRTASSTMDPGGVVARTVPGCSSDRQVAAVQVM